MKKKIITAVLGICLTTTVFGGIMQSQALSLGSLLGGAAKIGGVGVVISKFGPQIDSFLNKILKQNNLSTEYTTKVVPIISVGTKGYIGAAQVTGPASSIEQVEAVAQVEASFNGMIRVKGLVPVDSTNPVGASRVQGVGVSAIIDLKI
ncbi:hypothetical protein [Veillonella caviae]|uniref:hypothetical protein n=1 Tax=Veillonella caviae TaxID=248316 RepID=UPI00235334DF|nr:hypothetical protein [Veillonella caviae]